MPSTCRGVCPDRAFDCLKGLWKLLLRIREDASTPGVVGFDRILWNHYIGRRTGTFDRFNVDRGAVFEGNWSELSHWCLTVAGCQLQFSPGRTIFPSLELPFTPIG